MGTEVLRSQDCLGERFGACPPAFHRRKNSSANGNGFGNVRTNNYGYRKPLNRSERLDMKRKPTQQTEQQFYSPRRTSSAVELQNHLNKPANHHQNGIEMGHVTILRRGQSLDSFETNLKRDSNNNRTKGGITRNNLNVDGGYGDALYAGSAFSVSPSPESLPLPSFFNSNHINNNSRNNKKCEYEDSATRDLRRLLRLE